MRLVVILTLGLGVCGPMLINAEKIVFVVPRYIRRSYTSSPPPFHGHGHKVRHPAIQGSKRPHFGAHYGSSSVENEPFYPDEQPRAPQSSGDFDQSYFTPKEEVNHVIIPHGKGISHGVSFGKGYLPHDPFKGGNYNYDFPAGNGNNLEYAGQSHQGDVNFEDDGYSGFQNQDQGAPAGAQSPDWPFSSHQASSYAPVNYDQEMSQEEPRFQQQDAYRSQEPKEELFFPKPSAGEEQHGVLEENLPSARSSSNAAPPVVLERKLTPIVLQDTVDMREYVEKVEAFTKNWPTSTAALQGFGWKNQILNPPSLNLPNYQGFNSWSSGVTRPNGGYQVQEESAEEPVKRSYRTVMM